MEATSQPGWVETGPDQRSLKGKKTTDRIELKVTANVKKSLKSEYPDDSDLEAAGIRICLPHAF